MEYVRKVRQILSILAIRLNHAELILNRPTHNFCTRGNKKFSLFLDRCPRATTFCSVGPPTITQSKVLRKKSRKKSSFTPDLACSLGQQLNNVKHINPAILWNHHHLRVPLVTSPTTFGVFTLNTAPPNDSWLTLRSLRWRRTNPIISDFRQLMWFIVLRPTVISF